ncbi:copper chaperone PCu(A)C [Alkalilimnicola ehrlichii MLHE-1]|uniref:Copper chaperone PCu(A)C n=1 Tax=Alkalilimnicola ehrlichii (strain ATCC BAA-1101 / DSM 17681 / MLHE-1) TaxID=187272 RepID=Q0A7M9_ALKEH|nr:copper chaperone PCu(A)C [Alkalilimnicola ehrlichii]ABI57158.1 protein of unknown function DUF461 [Alkalilimnicola ehrlichii MLHE-1]
MKTTTQLTLAGLLTASLMGTVQALEVSDPWVRAMPPGHHSTAAYMQLENTRDEAVRVVRAQAPGTTERVELHTHIHDDGVMRMREVPDIEVPAGETVSLEPGGLHVMLMELPAMPETGSNVELILELDDGTELTLQAPVRDHRGGGHGH